MLIAVALAGCHAEPKRRDNRAGDTVVGNSTPSEECSLVDDDRDGIDACLDCDDTDSGIYPGASDTWYDGIDSDCAGNNDYDADGDGDARIGTTPRSYDCDDNDPSLNARDHDDDGYTSCDGDCDDYDPTRYPGAYRQCGDGLDSDCDGEPDCAMAGEYQLPDPRHTTFKAQRPGSITVGRTGDPDNDGVAELLLGSGNLPGDVFIMEADLPSGSTTAAASAVIRGLGNSWTVADVTGDGIDDVIDSSYWGATTWEGPIVGDLSLYDAASIVSTMPLVDVCGMSEGDLNGDGLDDLWGTACSMRQTADAPFRGPGVWLIAGPVPVGQHGPDAMDAMLYSVEPERHSFTFPFTQSMVDVTGDGIDDVLVYSGRAAEAYLLSGPDVTGVAELESMAIRLTGTLNTGSNLGRLPGDLNGDGYQDLAVGLEPGFFYGHSGIAIVKGPILADQNIDDTSELFLLDSGFPDRLGDLNADGIDDYVLLSWEQEILIAHGPLPTSGTHNARDLVDLQFTFSPPGGSGQLSDVVPTGDMNADGLADFMVGATWGQQDDAVFLIFGSGPGW